MPKPIKKPVHENIVAFKTRVATIYKKYRNTRKYEIKETDSALEKFLKQYTIVGRVGEDPRTFLIKATSNVIELLSQNHQTKVKMSLQCDMTRTDMKTGKEIIADPAPTFWSDTKEVLEATDVRELYWNAIDKMLESMASFQNRGSNWRFKSIIGLDIHTV